MKPHLIPSTMLLVVLATAASAAPPPRRPADAEDILYFAPDRPFVVRFHTRLDGGLPHEPLRCEFIDSSQSRIPGRPIGRTQEPDGAPLFACMDADSDGRLSKSEFQRIAETLRMLDLDDDETISTDELDPLGNPYAPVMTGPAGSSTPNGILMPVSAVRSPRDLAKQLIERYDRAEDPSEKDNRLNCEELGLAGAEFERFDLDAGGNLDFDELTQWIRQPTPAVEIVVRLGTGETADSSVELIKPGNAAEATIRKSAAGPAILTIGDLQVEVGVDSSTAGDRVILRVGTETRNLFEIFDRNGDRRLSIREFRTAAKGIGHWDQDGDGSISKSEVPSHVRLEFSRSPSAAGRAQNVVPDASRAVPTWFQMMDRNADGDLARREFLGGIDHFELLDADADGLIDAREASAWSPGPAARGL